MSFPVVSNPFICASRGNNYILDCIMGHCPEIVSCLLLGNDVCQHSFLFGTVECSMGADSVQAAGCSARLALTASEALHSTLQLSELSGIVFV